MNTVPTVDRRSSYSASLWPFGLILLALLGLATLVSGFWLGTSTHEPSLPGHDSAFIWQGALNLTIAAAYTVLGLWWVQQLRLHPLGKLAGGAFFIACAFTHIDLAIHAFNHAPLMIEPHMFWIHGIQAVVDWTFVVVAWRYRGLVVESEGEFHARLQRLESVEALAEVREEERRRWARELHDQTLQGLAATRMGLSVALTSEGEKQNDMIARSMESVDQEITALRTLIAELRPQVLEELGLQEGLETLGSVMGERYDMDVDVKVDLLSNGAAAGLGNEMEATIYRVVQEALTNASKHADAEHVRVSVLSADSQIEISVADDGRGFDTDERHDGFGLIGIRERADLLGGRTEIASRPGSGTVIKATLPVPKP